MNNILLKFLNHLNNESFRNEFSEYLNRKITNENTQIRDDLLKEIDTKYAENIDFYLALFEKVSEIGDSTLYTFQIKLLDFIILYFLLNTIYSPNIKEGSEIDNVEDFEFDNSEITDKKEFVYIQKLKDIKEKIKNNDIKAVLLRKLSWLEPDETFAVDMLREALFLIEDKEELKFIYYELIQRLLSIENFEEAEHYLNKAKEEYEDNDAFYEMDGHFGMLYYDDEQIEKAKEYLKNVYEWLIYRSMDNSLNNEFLTSNFIVFLDTYALISLEEKNIEKASEIYSFSFEFLKKFINIMYKNSLEENLKFILEKNIEDFLNQYAKFLSEKEKKSELGFDILYFELLKHELLNLPSLDDIVAESIENFQFKV